jgi:hypothetical protein
VTELLPPSPGDRLAKAQGKPARAARRGDLQAMSARAERYRWRLVRPPEESRLPRPIRLWLPLTPFFVLLAPFALLIMGIAVFLPRPLGVNPAHLMLGVGRMLLALNGTQVEVESPHASVLIKIF